MCALARMIAACYAGAMTDARLRVVDLLDVVELERVAKQRRLSMAQACRIAGVAPSTWQRWKQGQSQPRVPVMLRIRDAVLTGEPHARRKPAKGARC
jgi:hypothetical protein